MRFFDRTIIILLLVAGVGLFLSTFSSEYDIPAFSGDVGTVFVPRIYLILWVALSLLVLLQMRSSPEEEKREETLTFSAARLCMIIGIAAATAVAMLTIGFVFGLIPGFILFCWAFGYRRPLVLILISVVGTLGIWVLFNSVFELPLPKSPWFNSL